MFAHAGTQAVLSDIVVRDTRSRGTDGLLGHGFHVQEGTVVELSQPTSRRRASIALAQGAKMASMARFTSKSPDST